MRGEWAWMSTTSASTSWMPPTPRPTLDILWPTRASPGARQKPGGPRCESTTFSTRVMPIAQTSLSATTAISPRAGARCSCPWISRATKRNDVAWIIYIVSGLLSLGFIVHCIKTGGNTIWVYVLVVLITFPFVGSMVYFGAEILPGLLRSRTSQRAMRGIRTTLDPEGNLRKYENEMQVTGNVASRQRYADELVKLGRATEALAIYQTCLTGVFVDDPKLLLGYAHAQFEAGDPAAARRTLDDLIQKNPQF